MSLTCRVCLFKIEPDSCRDIFSMTKTGLLISEILSNFASIKIVDGDGLPNLLCASCEEKVNLIIDFRIQIITSNLALRKLNSLNRNEQSIKIEPNCDPFNNQNDITIESHEIFVSDHEKVNDYICKICNKDFATEQCLQEHEDIVHDEERQFKCYECERAFNDCQDLNSHNELYHSETGDKCEVSEQIFTLEKMDIDEGSDSSVLCAPSSVIETAQKSSLKLLPEKSRQKYEISYKQFMKWRKAKDIKSSFSENVLIVYFGELSEKIKPNSLWTQYSMLRSTLSIHHDVDITNYLKLKALLKRKSDGYKPKKSNTLTSQEINRFLLEAPDDKYLFTKVALIIGIAGACRKQELSQLKIDDIEDLRSAVIIKVSNSKTKKPRTFTITGKFYKIYKKYADLRPQDVNCRRFFLNYQKQKCTKQPVGINKFGSIPKQIATYLHLKNPELYTGHCFRRSSATIFVDGGGDRYN